MIEEGEQESEPVEYAPARKPRQFGGGTYAGKGGTYAKSGRGKSQEKAESQEETLYSRLQDKIRYQAERLQMLEDYKILCERRILELSPGHNLPIQKVDLGKVNQRSGGRGSDTHKIIKEMEIMRRDISIKDQDTKVKEKRIENLEGEVSQLKLEKLQNRGGVNSGELEESNIELQRSLREIDTQKRQLEETLRSETMVTEEQRSYIEVLKQALEAKIVDMGLAEMLSKRSREGGMDVVDVFAEMAVLKKQTEEAKRELMKYHSEYNDMEGHILDLKAQLEDERHTNNELRRAKGKAEQDIDLGLDAMKEAKETITKLDTEKAAMIDYIDQHLQKEQNLENNYRDLKGNVQLKGEENENIKREIDLVNKERRLLEDRTFDLAERYDDQKNRTNKLVNQLDNLDTDYKATTDRLTDKTGELHSAMSQIEQLSTKLTTEKDKSSILGRELSIKDTGLAEVRKDLKEQIHDTEILKTQLEGEKDYLNIQLENLEKILDQQKENMNNREKYFSQEFESQEKRHGEEVQSLRMEIDTLRLGEERNQVLLSKQNKTISDKEATIDQMRKTNSKLTESLGASQGDTEELLESHENLNAKYNELEADHEKLNLKHYRMENEIKEEIRAKEEAKKDVERKRYDLEENRSAFDNELYRKNMELSDHKMQFNTLKETMETDRDLKSKEIKDLYDNSMNYRNEILNLKNEVRTHKEAGISKQDDIDKLRQDLSEKLKEMDHQTQKVDELQIRKIELETKVKMMSEDATKATRNMNENIRNLDDLESTLAMKLAELRATENELHKIKLENKKLNEKRAETMEKNNTLSNNLQTVNIDNEDLEEALRNQLIQNDDQINRLDDQSRELEGLKTTTFNLTENLSAQEQDLQATKIENTSIRQELEDISILVIQSLKQLKNFASDFNNISGALPKSRTFASQKFKDHMIKLESFITSHLEEQTFYYDNTVKLQESVTYVLDELNRVLNQLRETMASKDKLGKEIRSMESDVKNLLEEESNLQGREQYMSKEIASLKTTIIQLEKEKEFGQKREIKFENDLNEAKSRLSVAESRNSKLERELDDEKLNFDLKEKENQNWKGNAESSVLLVKQLEDKIKILSSEKKDYEALVTKIHANTANREMQKLVGDFSKLQRDLHLAIRDRIDNENKLSQAKDQYRDIEQNEPSNKSAGREITLKYDIQHFEDEDTNIRNYIGTLRSKMATLGIEMKEAEIKERTLERTQIAPVPIPSMSMGETRTMMRDDSFVKTDRSYLNNLDKSAGYEEELGDTELSAVPRRGAQFSYEGGLTGSGQKKADISRGSPGTSRLNQTTRLTRSPIREELESGVRAGMMKTEIGQSRQPNLGRSALLQSLERARQQFDKYKNQYMHQK